MKKTLTTFIFFISFIISMFGQVRDTVMFSMLDQVRDTVMYGNCAIIVDMDTVGFRKPMVRHDEDGNCGRQYVYLRQYEHSQSSLASYIFMFLGDCLLPYMLDNPDYWLYSQRENRYGGLSMKWCNNDGLYFRHDTYKEYVGYKVSVAYYFVREEDLELFEHILDNVELKPIAKSSVDLSSSKLINPYRKNRAKTMKIKRLDRKQKGK